MEEAQPSPSTRVETSRHSCCVGLQKDIGLTIDKFFERLSYSTIKYVIVLYLNALAPRTRTLP